MTGTLSAPLFIWGAFANGTPRYLLSSFAIICLFVAAGRVWHKENQRVAKIQGELEAERSVRSAPDIGLTLGPEKQLLLANRSEDKDAHNISLRSITTSTGYVLSAQPLPFLKRGATVPYTVSAWRGHNGLLWDQDPDPLEPFPPNSLSREMPLFVEFGDRRGSVVYVAEFRLVEHRLLGKSIRQVGVSVVPGVSSSETNSH